MVEHCDKHGNTEVKTDLNGGLKSYRTLRGEHFYTALSSLRYCFCCPDERLYNSQPSTLKLSFAVEVRIFSNYFCLNH